MSLKIDAKILLIDDDRDVCTVMQSGLQRRGLVVTTFNDPVEALSQYVPRRYSKIILDVRMPGITGFQLAKKIWAIDPDAKICFLSAFEIYENEARMLFKDLKSTQFIKKPITPSALAERITEELRHNQ